MADTAHSQGLQRDFGQGAYPQSADPAAGQAPGPGQAVSTFNLITRLREHAYAVLRLVIDLRVPFTDNLAERAIRMPKVKQKISGCFRRFEGAQNFCTIRSYFDAMHKQGQNMFEVLRQTSMGRPPSSDSD